MMLIYLSAEWFIAFIAFIIELYADGVSVRDFVLHSPMCFLSFIFIFNYLFYTLFSFSEASNCFYIAKKT